MFVDSSASSSPTPKVGSRRPFFTVIICTFQRERLLERALDSLLAQVETDWEAIVVDDGSTDGTCDVVQRYASRNSDIRYMWHANRGTGTSRNAGMLASTGLFITFLDSDDEYKPDHLWSRRQMLVDNSTVEFLHGGADIHGNPWVADKDDSSRKIHLDECVIGGTFVIRRDVLLGLGGFDAVRYADDALLYSRAVQAGVVIANTDHQSYVYHRDTADSLCTTYGTT